MWVVQGLSLPQLGMSVTVVLSYVKVTFSNFLEISKPEPGSSVIRGESAEAINLYSSNHKHFCSVQACLVTSDVSDSLRPYGL